MLQRGEEERRLEAKIEVARQEGRVFDSLDKAVCEIHPDASFIQIGGIPGSSSFVGNGDKQRKPFLSTYECEMSEDHPGFVMSKAYDCGECGIVIGEPSPHNEVGNRVTVYHCTVCGTQVGVYREGLN